jgi:valyl-tRNA synthetase
MQNGASAPTLERLARHEEALLRLARLERVVPDEQPIPEAALVVVIDEATFALPVGDVVDLEQERRRLRKEIDKAAGEAAKIKGKLDNPSFVERAPAEVVLEQRERLLEARTVQERLAAALARIA